MGVRGLSSFLKNKIANKTEEAKNQVLQKNQPESSSKENRIVIDGRACIYYLARHDTDNLEGIYGGNYLRFKENSKKFITALINDGYSLHFYMDGPDNEKTSANKRATSKITAVDYTLHNFTKYRHSSLPLPCLATQAFVEVVKEVEVDHSDNIKLIYCDGEADPEVFKEANTGDGAIVFSGDSDFFIFDLPKGFCFLDEGFIKFENEDKITFEVFKPGTLAEVLDIDPKDLPLFASLVGNDYVNDDFLKNFHGALLRNNRSGGQQTIVKVVAEFIKDKKNALKEAVIGIVDLCWDNNISSKYNINKYSVDCEELFEGREKKDCYEYVRNVLEKSMNQYINNNNNQNSDQTISAYTNFLERYKAGKLNTATLQIVSSKTFKGSVVVEDTSVPESVWSVSQSIRKVIYGILGDNSTTSTDASTAPAFQEFLRKDKELIAVPVEINDAVYAPAKGSTLSKEAKLNIFVKATRGNANCLKLPDRWILFALTMSFLLKSEAIEISEAEAKAEAVAILECLVRHSEWKNVTGHRENSSPPQITRKTAQFSGLWQTTIYCLRMLDEILEATMVPPATEKDIDEPALIFPPAEQTFDGFAFAYFLQAAPAQVVPLSENDIPSTGDVEAAVSHAKEGGVGLFNALLAVVLKKAYKGEWPPTKLNIIPKTSTTGPKESSNEKNIEEEIGGNEKGEDFREFFSKRKYDKKKKDFSRSTRPENNFSESSSSGSWRDRPSMKSQYDQNDSTRSTNFGSSSFGNSSSGSSSNDSNSQSNNSSIQSSGKYVPPHLRGKK